MCRNPNRGRVYRRCACRDTAGKQLGARCPELTNRRHGRWAFAVDLPTIDGQRKTLRRCGFPTQNQARTALRRVLACEQAGIHVDDRQTVAEYLEAWLEVKQRSLKPTTMARYLDYVHKDLVPPLGAIRLEELTHHHIAGFVRAQLATGRGHITLHRCVATLSSALTDAVRHHRLTHNPARYANIPRPRRSPRVCWSPAQAVAFLRYCAQVHDPLAELYELILCTGLRKGEALALHWADIDLDSQMLNVRYTLSNINNTTPVFTTQDQEQPHLDRALLPRRPRPAPTGRTATRPATGHWPGLPRPGPCVHPARRATPSTRVHAAPPPPIDQRGRPAAHPGARPAPFRRHDHAVLESPAGDGVQDDAALHVVDHHRGLRPPAPPRRPASHRRHRHRAHLGREPAAGRLTTTSRPPDDRPAPACRWVPRHTARRRWRRPGRVRPHCDHIDAVDHQLPRAPSHPSQVGDSVSAGRDGDGRLPNSYFALKKADRAGSGGVGGAIGVS
jgi:integrase